MEPRLTLLRPFGLAALTAVATACGGGDDGDGSSPDPVGTTCTAGARVDVAGTAATPACLLVAPGASVTIANGRTAALEVRSAPHPTHGSCPELDATPPIPAGGSISVVMVTVASCSFHDHATGAQLGVIRVQSPANPGDPGDPGDPDPGPY